MNGRMKSTDDTALNRLVTRWMHDEAPPRAPDRLLDDVRVAASASPQRSTRGPMRLVLGVLAAAAILVLAIFAATQVPGLLDDVGTEPSMTASPSVVPSATPADTVSPSATPAGMPTGAGESLMSFTPACDVVPPIQVPSTTILEDGRVIWRDEDGAYHVRQLGPGGLDQVRDEIDQTGLFESSATYELVRREDAPEPPGRGVCLWSFAWSDGTVDVSSVAWLGDEEEATYYEPSPERERLDALAQQLIDPEAWLTDDAWLQPEAAPFKPDRYVIQVSLTDPQAVTEGAPDLDTVSWPLDAAPDASGRCEVAEAAAVEQFAAELAQAGLEQFAGPLSGAGAILPWAAQGTAVDVSIWYQMPDGKPTCVQPDAGMPEVQRSMG